MRHNKNLRIFGYCDKNKGIIALVFDEGSAERIRSYFNRIGRTMTDNNLQQAMLPEGCTILPNDWGTAPGCAFEADGVLPKDVQPQLAQPLGQHLGISVGDISQKQLGPHR